MIKLIEEHELFIYDREDEDKLKLSNYQRTQLVDVLSGLLKQGVITDKSWVEKAQNDMLTVSELTWLNTILLARK
ncbi:hypothetical protein [Paenibacillus selenitireducens]|uniref:hypothetical protein n=1 Tax=Paenibacillus selenitireducens TaxID=1324314 RepID=UPI002FCE3095